MATDSRADVEATRGTRGKQPRDPVALHLCNLPRRRDRPRQAMWATARDRDFGFDWPDDLSLVTYSNRPTAGPLEMQAARQGWPLHRLGCEGRWRNVDKIALLDDFVRSPAARPYVLACDNDDVLLQADPRAAVAELTRRRIDLLFGAEANCYPPSPAMQAAQTAIATEAAPCFLNSGQIVLHRDRSKRWLELARRQPASVVDASDQDRWHPLYAAHPSHLGIDFEERVFRIRSLDEAAAVPGRPDVPVTLSLLSWKRPANVLRILEQTLRHPRVTDAIVWNNNAAAPLPVDWLPPEQRDRVQVIMASRDVGLRSRWHAASLAGQSLVLMQDDDHLLPPTTIDRLVAASVAQPSRLHGVEGRRPQVTRDDRGRLRVRYDIVPRYGPVPMLLGHAVTMPRELAAELAAVELRFRHACGYDPSRHGDDIFYSYASTAILGKPPHAANRPRQPLPNPHRLSGRPGHREHRERLIADCLRFFRLPMPDAPPG